MKTPLSTKVDLGPGHIVLDGVPAIRKRGTAAPPLFGACLLWPRSPISAAAELIYYGRPIAQPILFSSCGFFLFFFLMVALRSRCGHYIFVLFLLSFFVVFFPRLISAVADWMSTILPHMVWLLCEFRMQV